MLLIPFIVAIAVLWIVHITMNAPKGRPFSEMPWLQRLTAGAIILVVYILLWQLGILRFA